MTATFALSEHVGKQPSAPLIMLLLNATLDSSYPAGGYTFDPAAQLQALGNYDKAPTVVDVLTESKGDIRFKWDRDNNKLQAVQPRGQNIALAAAGLAIGSGSKKKVLIANTVTFLIDGVFKSKTTAEVDFTATTHDIAADANFVQERVYLYSLNASGTPTVTAGEISSGAGTAKVPACPAGQAAIGFLRLAVAAGATPFNATSDDLDAAHLTDTYTDVGLAPSEAGSSAEVPTGTDLSTLGTVKLAILAS